MPIDGKAIARQVRKLLKKRGAKDRFRSAILNWKRTYDFQKEVEQDWEQKRKDHFYAAQSDDRLRNEKLGPPQEGWVFETTILRGETEDGIFVRLPAGAWCPPELSIHMKPVVHWPTSFCDCSYYGPPEEDSDRALSLPEKFVLLAAFHDAHWNGVEKINPFPEAPNSVSFDRMTFESVCSNVQELHKADVPIIEEFIEDVSARLDFDAYLSEFARKKQQERVEFAAAKPMLSDASNVVLHFLELRETYYRERIESDPTYNTSDPSIDVLIYDNPELWAPSDRPQYGATDSEIDYTLKETWPGMPSTYFDDVIASLTGKNLIYRCDPFGVRFEESNHDFSKDENVVFRISEHGKRCVLEASEEAQRPANPRRTKNADSTPEANGFVAHPTDLTAYVPQSEIRCDDKALSMNLTDRRIGIILENFQSNGIRWTRPLTKDGRHHKQRRLVHLRDWTEFLKRVENADREQISEDVLEARKAMVRNGR